jgi:hypothetical protein
MTSEFKLSKFEVLSRKSEQEQVLISPATLLVLLALLFTFFLTASKSKNYLQDQEREIIKTEIPEGKLRKASALSYEKVATVIAPMPSILQ